MVGIELCDQIVILACQCVIFGCELNGKTHGTGFQVFRRHNDVVVLCRDLALLLPHEEVAAHLSLEVEHYVRLVSQVEGDDSLASYLFLLFVRDVEGQVVSDIADIGLSLLGEFLGNALLWGL